MPVRLAVTMQAALAIKREYEELDEWGRRRYSLAALAERFGVGETTVGRVVRNIGAYTRVPTPKPDDVLDQEAAASLERMKALMNPDGTLKPEVKETKKSAIDIFMERGKRVNPLTEDPPDEGEHALGKLAGLVGKVKAGEGLMDDMTKEDKDGPNDAGY